MSRRIRVAVLMGGRSSEHEISLASARSVLDSLDSERYEAVPVAIDREGRRFPVVEALVGDEDAIPDVRAHLVTVGGRVVLDATSQ